MSAKSSNTEGLLESFPRTLSRTAKSWHRLMNERLAGLGLSQAKWTALLLLDKSKDGLMQRELACHMGIEGASLVGLLDRMATDGWIERRPCAADRRANLVFLSAKSKGTLDKIHRIAEQANHELLDDIPAANLKACRAVLEAIGARAQSLTKNPSPQPQTNSGD